MSDMPRMFGQWLDDSPDLVNGVGVVADVIALEYRVVANALDAKDAISVASDLKKRDVKEALTTGVPLVAGKSVVHFMNEMKFGDEFIRNIFGEGTDKFTTFALEHDDPEKK